MPRERSLCGGPNLGGGQQHIRMHENPLNVRRKQEIRFNKAKYIFKSISYGAQDKNREEVQLLTRGTRTYDFPQMPS